MWTACTDLGVTGIPLCTAQERQTYKLLMLSGYSVVWIRDILVLASGRTSSLLR